MNRNRRLLAVVIGLAVFLPAAIAMAGGRKDHRLDDGQIRARVERALQHEKIEGAMVAVATGVVTLTGEVESAWARSEAEELAGATQDVASVSNLLTITAGRPDVEIQKDIETAVRKHVRYPVFDDVAVTVEAGRAELTGAVTQAAEAADLAVVASRVRGVQEVDNRLTVLPAAAVDERLRDQIKDRLFQDSAFADLAATPLPPIHVEVDNGRVTLTGFVDTRIQKFRAESIVRSVFGVRSVDNRLTVTRP